MSLLGKLLGRTGEDQAARFLVSKGYRILERNYSTRSGEIDLIALHQGTVAFIEVKTRSNDAFGAPELAVNRRKQQRMIKAALGYIKFKKLHQVPCRFDVVAISTANEQQVELIQNAFEMDRTHM
jgi:putative endonuclease